LHERHDSVKTTLQKDEKIVLKHKQVIVFFDLAMYRLSKYLCSIMVFVEVDQIICFKTEKDTTHLDVGNDWIG